DEFVIGEGSGHIDVTVTRAGDASGTATINFNTFDESQPGHASQKSDYEISLGKLTFNPGETSKTFRILIVNDDFAEGDEVVDLALSNPTGTGVGLGSPNQAELKITDDDSAFTPTTFSAAGLNPAAIQATVDAFRASLGANNGVGGTFATGRREINWDGVPDAASAPNNLAANFFNVNSPRGAVFSTSGTGFQVSANSTNPTSTPVRFGNINATYPATFQTFSPQRLFTALGSNITDVEFFIPGTTTPATVNAFGSVFTDVDSAGSTKIQYFDGFGSMITEQTVPALSGTANLSFLGLSITDRRIGRVRIISGNVAPGPNDSPPGNDVAVMDDFIYGEPQAIVPGTNPIDDPAFFVRQHYLDFLNREPDAPGLAFWTNQITSCGADAACVEVRRINVSAAFFLSIEFQRTGLEAYLTHRAAFGSSASGSPAPVLYGNFERDVQALQKNFVFGQAGADAILEANTQAYFADFVTRPEFVAKYPATLTNEQYVDNLLASAGLSPSQVRLFVVSLTNGQENPPTTPTTSTGAARPASFGTARFLFNSAQTAMSFTATINNIDVLTTQTADSNDNLIAAHIHAGPAVGPGVNGPVVWGFFGQPFNDNNPNDQVFGPLPSGVGGNFSGKWDAPEGNGTTLAAQLTNLRTGHAYINFHTVQFSGGEIRGNFPAETAFRESLVAGLNGATETRATILRKVAEAEELRLREFNTAFVTMEYFGYLRRDPDTAGFNFWLNKLNAFNGNFEAAEMVKAFIASSEYRQRFGAN
ncbi:MAG TPA: CHRD domain-containing protein, partial [Pyrinomonadaceae bacterium]|nr:CHRD domain-containing protein [Pyrinomonadaceae bacterium]